MRIQQIGFAVFDDAVSILEISLSLTDRLHLGASQRDTGLEFVEQKVVMSRCAVDGSIPFAGRNRFSGLGFLGRWIRGLRVLPGHTFGYESSC
jgi:hypothetical protein